MPWLATQFASRALPASARPPKGRETLEWSGSAQVEQIGKTVLFRASSAGQLHL